jgi:RNA polymerase sigma-70 factor, ECF subfamily
VLVKERATEIPEFADALRAHQSMVFSIAYHLLRDRATAEEVAQDVFLQLYRSFDSIESPEHLVFWLRRTASHRSIDCARRRRLRAAIALDRTPEPSVEAEPGDPFLNERLRVLLASLPAKPRMVMVLRYQEDLTPEEIAKVLDMPVATVKSSLHRSLALLRRKLGGANERSRA